jgi:MOSC domain-containing protein YiiM
MKKVGRILELFISIEGSKNRVKKASFAVDKSGILDDKFYGKNIQRSILLSSDDSYVLSKNQGIDLSYGLLGENILMDFNPYSLEVGTEIKIGEVILEITQVCTICNHLSKVDKKLPKLLKNDRGIFAKVIKSGILHVNDAIFML